MRAARYERYGSPEVLDVREIEKPTATARTVLVRVQAASVNPYDWHFMRGSPLVVRALSGLRGPKPERQTLGVDFAGTVEAVGEKVTQFAVGDDVFGLSTGAFAEYVRAPEDRLTQKPANVSFDAAASVPVAGLTALQCLRNHGQLQSGQRVLVNGAAGGVGTFAVQIAKHLGADVTAVCSTRNLELVRSIGADRAIDYTEEDFARVEDQRYDLILDAVGNRSLADYRRVLAPDGVYVAAAASPQRALWMTVSQRGRMRSMTAKPNADDLRTLADLLEAGDVTPVIDRRYPLSEVPNAIRYLEKGHARGKVAITI